MPIPELPTTPYGVIKESWKPWLEALEAWQPSRKVLRPHLYQPAGDREIVREKLSAFPTTIEQYRKAAESALEAEIPSPDEGLRAVGTLIGRAVACANWWLLSLDERAARRAWEISLAIMEWPRWVADEHLPLTIDLKSAAAVRALSNVLDRMSDWLQPDQKAAIANSLRDRGVLPFVAIHDSHGEWWTYSLHNWRSVIDGAFGIAAIAIRDTLPTDMVKRALKHSVIGVLTILDQGDEDGGWYEGVSYWSYGIGEAVQFMDVLQRVTEGKVDLFTHPYIGRTGDFCLYETWPDGRVHNWGDCGDRVNAGALMARLAAATQRSDWQAYVRKFPAAPSIESLFWEDPSLPASDLASLPRAKRFRGTEVAVIRSGWADDDVIVGLKAGKTTANHSHLDMGSLVINCGRHCLVADAGHWPYAHSLGFFDLDFPEGARWDFPGLATECHSTILMDGQGQQYGEGRDAVIVACADGDDYAYATVDATRAYPNAARFVRYVLLIRPATIVVVDELASPSRCRFGWRAVVPEVPVRGSSTKEWSLTTSDGSSSLSMRCLLPGEENGLLAEVSQVAASYPATNTRANPVCQTLTFSNLVRARQATFAVAMRVSHGTPLAPAIEVEHIYRGLQIHALDGGKKTWAIMWGEPGVRKVSTMPG
ncbi:MAG TPA: heparinase II/III family protein [Candidatus Latescibacteria bacterium]|nr:heparinase II/III family protein [Candidatus Latescibacterota bacterium]